MNEYIIKINDVDVSDYIIACDRIPYVSRNRDYSLVAEGFEFEISDNYSTAINNDEIVLVTNPNAAPASKIFYGFVHNVTQDYRNHKKIITVKNYLEKLALYTVDYNTLKVCIDSLPASDTGNAFTVNVAAHHIIKLGGHLLSDADRIVFRGDDLPYNIQENHIYWVRVVDGEKFRIYESYANYIYDPSNGYPAYYQFTDAGSGTMTYHIPDLSKFSDRDNQGYPIISIQHLLDKIGEITGITLDYQPIETQNYYVTSPVTQTTIDYLKLDFNMLLAINQSSAMPWQQTDENLHISLFDLLSSLCSIFGWCLKYNDPESIGQARFIIVSQDLDENYYPAVAQPYYSIDDDDVHEKQVEETHVEQGFIIEQVYAARSAYVSGGETDTQAIYYYGNGKRTNVKYYNNLLIYNSTEAGKEYTGSVMPLFRFFANKIIAYSYGFNRQKFITNVQLSEPTVKAEYLNIGYLSSVIEQEINLTQEIELIT